MGIIGAFLTTQSLELLISSRVSYVGIVSSLIIGTALSLPLITIVAGPVWRYLAAQGLAEPSIAREMGLSFAIGFALAYAVAPLTPSWYLPVGWYVGLTLSPSQ